MIMRQNLWEDSQILKYGTGAALQLPHYIIIFFYCLIKSLLQVPGNNLPKKKNVNAPPMLKVLPQMKSLIGKNAPKKPTYKKKKHFKPCIVCSHKISFIPGKSLEFATRSTSQCKA